MIDKNIESFIISTKNELHEQLISLLYVYYYMLVYHPVDLTYEEVINEFYQ